MKKNIVKFFIWIIYLVVIMAIAYLLKWPQSFDSYVQYENYILSAHLTLIFYRLLIYIIFPFAISALEKIKSKERFIKLLLTNFNIQFVTYALLTGIYVILGIDKILDVEIFNSADAIIFVATFIFTTILNKKIPSIVDKEK